MPGQRYRKRTWNVEDSDLIDRALTFFDDDESSRTLELDLSLQRYAKFRQWRDEQDDPLWEDSSDAAVPDMMTLSLRTQDTLYNAVMAERPALLSKATEKKDKDKQDNVDLVLDKQLLEENGTQWLSDAIDHFTNDGHATALVVWVDESRKITETMTVEAILEGLSPGEHFLRVLQGIFGPDALITPARNVVNSWDWTILEAQPQEQSSATPQKPEEIFASFYSSERSGLELDISRQVKRFQGPKVITKQRSDVLTPVAVENLQMPGPSNPRGSPHVILVDRPTILEIKGLKASGFYDSLTDDDIETLENTNTWDENLQEQQRSTIGGESELPTEGPPDHKRVTRLMVFDVMNLDAQGQPEDVVYWVLKETKQLARKRRLFEAFPSRVPRRPLAEGQMVPIPGRRTGIGMLEMIEGIHDLRKQITDQVVNFGSLLLTPWFFYRPTGVMKPEVIRLWPGEGYPLNDPKSDVFFPSINAQGLSYGLNMLAMAQQDEERLSLISDMNLGRVPAGKASALRTVGGMAMIGGQSDARPERILRRFSEFLGQVWLQAHELNRHFLDRKKSFRIAVPIEPGEDPYRSVGPDDLNATFEFSFKLNVFNTSKDALLQSYMQLAELYLSEIGFMTGVSSAKTVYGLFRDIGRVLGQEPDKYIDSPAGQPLISIEEVLVAIMNGEMPHGAPAEGPEQQLQLLQAFTQSEKFGLLAPDEVELFNNWLQVVQGMALQQQQQQALAQAAGRGQGGQGAGAAQAPAPVDNSQAQLQPNELMDETLPTAGGGGAIV